MTNKLIFLIILLSISIKGYNQNSYFIEAEVVLTDSIKIKGFVKRMSESSLNPSIIFKQKIDDRVIKEIPVDDIKELFFIEDSTLFQKVIYDFIDDTIKKDEYRLAKKLVHGYAQLFKLQLPENEWNIVLEHNNTHVYIVLIDNNYYVLYQKEKHEGDKYKLYKKYQYILNYILRDYKDLQSKSFSVKFDDKAIISVINDLNNYHPDVESYLLYKEEKQRLLHGPMFGLASLILDNKFVGRNYCFGYGLSFNIPAVSERFSSDVSLYYCMIEFENQMKYSYVRIPLGVKYSFSNSNLAPFLGGGVSMDISKNDAMVYLKGKVGAVLYKKILLSAELDYGLDKHLPQNILYFNVAYLFGK